MTSVQLAAAVYVREGIAFALNYGAAPHVGPYTTVLIECRPVGGGPMVCFHAHGWN